LVFGGGWLWVFGQAGFLLCLPRWPFKMISLLVLCFLCFLILEVEAGRGLADALGTRPVAGRMKKSPKTAESAVQRILFMGILRHES
jgi:hypothetical protein